MGQSLILLIEELAQGMTEAFAAVNDGFSDFEQALNLPLITAEADFVLPNVAGAYTLAEIDLVRYMVFQFEALTMDTTITIPALTNGNPTHRVIIFVNADVNNRITLTTDDPGTTVDLPPLSTRMVSVQAGDVTPLLEGNYITGFPLLINGFAATPAHLDQFYRYTMTENAFILDAFGGSTGSIRSSHLPSLPVRVQVSLNEVVFGYANISTAGVVTWEFNTPGDQPLVIGDEIDLVFLRPQWGTIAFSGVALDSNAILINDGHGHIVPFVFGSGADGTVNKGANATDSATNLQAAINASALEIDCFRSTATLTLRNNYTGYGGHITAIQGAKISFAAVAVNGNTVVLDDGTLGTTTLTYGGGGGNPATGATAANSASNLKAAINALAPGTEDLKAYLTTTTLLLIVNLQTAGGGTISIGGGATYTLTAFSVESVGVITDFAVDTLAQFLNTNVKAIRN